MTDPVLHLVAGPNGAGKTTLFQYVIAPETHLEWVNADEIAVGLPPDPGVAYLAAELAAQRRTALLDARASFATETVFSHASKVELVRTAVAAGYLVTLHVVLVPVELAVARVENRVEHGGHAVPEEKIRGRYARLWAFVAEAVGEAHVTMVYDNAVAANPFRLIATFERGHLVGDAVWPDWTPEELRTLN